MEMRGFSLTVVAASLFLMITGVTRAFGADDEVLAKIGNEVITRMDFETRLKSFAREGQRELRDLEKKKQLLDRMIKARLLATEAENKGLTEKPDVKAYLRMVRDDFITQEYVRAYIETKAGVSNDEAETYYNTNPEFGEREYLKVSQIVVEKEDEAKEILGRLKKGENFRKLARERSIDQASKAAPGELDWFEKGKQEKEIEDAVAKLEKEEISDIVKIKERYYIFRLDERRIVAKPLYFNVKDEIIARLKYKKIAELAEKEIEELKKKVNIETFYEKLSSDEK